MANDLPAAQWRKSSFSANENCVEVAADLPGRFAVRDSKNPTGAALVFRSAEWSAFLTALGAGEFDI
ncbi:DUF397 domain-containing protein [Sphaerisporangium aureirubrum]|uniref:DUF397 domain-containing protein n=1 Tax=Sphaerisporangium aureirubrum TaxID=1544736 RepID=A0ABW1NST6_9ACTN